jgi:hexokinase
MNAKNKVDTFLKQYDMHYDSINMEECMQAFIKDMQAGLEGRTDSLLMIPTYIGTDGCVPINEEIIVMDAGGTNFRVATVTFNAMKQPDIQNYALYPMPGTKGTLSKQQFFETVADYLMPVIHKSKKVGFCFSFPTEILPNHDGRLRGFNKEVSVEDMKNALIGEGINNELEKRGFEEKSFVVLNDTVATMLGGMMAFPERRFDSYIGFILGTGTNTCYVENNRNIVKSQEALSTQGNMAINLESGGYSNMPRGVFDEAFDATTSNPGDHKFEKMISGAYLGKVVRLTVKQAADDGLFSHGFEIKFEKHNDMTMRNIDDFCFYPFGDNVLAELVNEDDDDRLTLYYIIDACFERAAKMVAVNLGAILVKTHIGTDPTRPVCVAAEGTTFYKSKLFKTKLDFYSKAFFNEKLGIYCEFVKAENATLVGTAVAGLLN